MRLSDAITASAAKPLDIPFDNGGVLKVTYKPAKFTVRELELMTEKREPRVVIEQLLRVIESWDLTDNDETPIPLETEALLDIDIDIFVRIITEVGKDQRPSGEPASS